MCKDWLHAVLFMGSLCAYSKTGLSECKSVCA